MHLLQSWQGRRILGIHLRPENFRVLIVFLARFLLQTDPSSFCPCSSGILLALFDRELRTFQTKSTNSNNVNRLQPKKSPIFPPISPEREKHISFLSLAVACIAGRKLYNIYLDKVKEKYILANNYKERVRIPNKSYSFSIPHSYCESSPSVL